MNEPEREDAHAMALRVLAWFRSAASQEALAESEHRVQATEELLAKGRDIDPNKLHEPFTL